MTQTARPYHHGDLRSALVEAGLEATRGGGPSALGLRDVTRRVGVSANAAYRHFADREALLRAVAAAIFDRVAESMTASDALGTDRDWAIGRLRAVGLGYIDFARREPGWFSVVFFGWNAGNAVATPAPQPFVALIDALDGMVSCGALSRENRVGAEWLCWSAVHGFAELVIRGPLHEAPAPEVDRLAVRTVDAIIAGLETALSDR